MHQRGGRGYQDFPSKIFCLTVPKISVGESFTVALISGIEKVWIEGGGGVSRFSVENFLSHSAEIFLRGTLNCFTNFRYRKSLDRRGGGRGEYYQDFPSKIFCLTVPKIFLGEPLIVSLTSGTEKVWIGGGGEGGEYFFVSQCRNISLENTLVLFQKNFIENFHA